VVKGDYLILINTAKASVPAKRFSPHLKPNWDHSLKEAHCKSKAAYKVWVRAGRPRNQDHPIRRRYKNSKATF